MDEISKTKHKIIKQLPILSNDKDKLQVVCFKWYKKKARYNHITIYDHNHVNQLYYALLQYLDMPFEFVCFTDDVSGIHPDIYTILLPEEIKLLKARYTKLLIFADEMKYIIGNHILCLDLDTVITDDITSLVDINDDFKIYNGTAGKGTPYNSSLIRMKAGKRKHVWDNFNDHSYNYVKQSSFIGSDQAWIGLVLGSNEKTYTRLDGIYLFRNIRQHRQLPNNAKIVFFSGTTDPSHESLHEKYNWIKQYWCRSFNESSNTLDEKN